jgi:tetratricopeptide (TPR) repeat protein
MAGWAAFGLMQLAGRLAEANQITGDTFAIGEAGGQVDAGVIHAVQRYTIAYEWGRLDELEAEFIAVAERLGPVVESMCAYVALIHCEAGRLDRAREAFAPIVARGYDLPEDTIWLGMTQMAAEIVHRLDDREGAAILLDRLAPYEGIFSAFAGITMGCTTQFLGLLETTLGRLDAAIAHLADAAEIYERVGAPAFLGRTQVAWARALLSRRSPGDAEQAQSLLTAAVTAAREFGFVAVERRAAPLLEQI